MTKEEIFKGIKECLHGYEDHFDINSLAYCTNMREEFNFDSLDYVEFAMILEDHFGIDIRDEEAEKCYIIADLINLIYSNIQKRDHLYEEYNDTPSICLSCKYFQCDKPNVVIPSCKNSTTRFNYITRDVDTLAGVIFDIKYNTPWHSNKEFKEKEIEKIKKWLLAKQ